MVTESDLHSSVVLLAPCDGYPAGTEGFLVDVTSQSAVVEIDRLDDNPDLVMLACADVQSLGRGTQAA